MILTVLAIVVTGTFVFTGGIKLFNVPASLAIRDSLDVPPAQWRVIGVLEWLGAAGVAVGLAYHPLGLLAAIALGRPAPGGDGHPRPRGTPSPAVRDRRPRARRLNARPGCRHRGRVRGQPLTGGVERQDASGKMSACIAPDS